MGPGFSTASDSLNESSDYREGGRWGDERGKKKKGKEKQENVRVLLRTFI